jgi:hypothetical protein
MNPGVIAPVVADSRVVSGPRAGSSSVVGQQIQKQKDRR